MAEDRSKDFLTPVLNEVEYLPNTEELTVLPIAISDCIFMFSLFGDEVDLFLDKFLELRAIDQKLTADLMVRKIFNFLFKRSSRPCFNLLINLEKKIDLEQFEKEYPAIDADRLEAKNPDGTFKFYKAEVDAAILVDLFPQPPEGGIKDIDRGYIFTEMKMFTAPKNDQGKSLRALLQNASLDQYFRLRYIYGVIGVSYLRSLADHAPIGKNDPCLQDLDFTPTNILHVAFMDARVLDQYKNAPNRTAAILSAIQNVQKKVRAMAEYEQKAFKFELIYNILKVIKMSQKIASLENRLQQLRREAESIREEKQKAQEEKQKAQEEKQKAQEEKQKAQEEKQKVEEENERLREKLKSLGIDPDSL